VEGNNLIAKFAHEHMFAQRPDGTEKWRGYTRASA
jgi:hypothetical protein